MATDISNFEFIKTTNQPPLDYKTLSERVDSEVTIEGTVHRLRVLPQVTFLIIRGPRFCVQTVVEPPVDASTLKEGDFIRIQGRVLAANLSDKTIFPRNIEIKVSEIKTIHAPATIMPFDISKKVLNVGGETLFDMRPISLRHPKVRAVFKISESIVNAFHSFLSDNGFTRIFSPKIVFAGAEGGANIFQIQYFDRVAYLAQSPQFYKQFGIGVFGRVYDVGTVFRAEKHNTNRHLNEYVSLDLEMGFIESHLDVMNMEAALLRYMMDYLRDNNQFELDLLEVTLPIIGEQIPIITLDQAHEIYYKKKKIDMRAEPDLAAEEEKYLTEWSLKEFASEFLFVTHYPTMKRPFYTKDDPAVPDKTRSFDLLFRGIEITTGGQRINDYDEQVAKFKRFGLNPDDFASFLQMHKYGAPPHGGLAIGLERLTARLCNITNIKEATFFPRDIHRITP
ncbi:MAG: aspartate--tRNA(Asn) ligase [Oligoflexia bacterium]|nr:aspartate--tRNA(Asn) ligase [Oligoflexia bacterium]